MRPRNPAKWLTAAAIVGGAGGTLAAAYWIPVFNEHGSFWHAPGYAALGLLAIGALLLLVGLLARDEPREGQQTIHAGDGSTNLQVTGGLDMRSQHPEDGA